MTDREQVIIKAITHVGQGRTVEVSKVIKAVGYPRATTKKILVDLANRGVVVLHRHDYPQSLSSVDRKMMIRIGRDYFGAVSMRNPATILTERIPIDDVRSTMLALSRSPFDGLIGAHGDEVRGAYAHPKILYLLFYAGDLKRDGTEYRVSDVVVDRAGQLVDQFYNDKRKAISGNQFLAMWRKMKRRNPQVKGKGKKAARRVGRALKRGAGAVLAAGADILGAGAGALANPRREHLPGLPAKAQREYERILKESKEAGRYRGREKEVAARTVRKQYGPNPHGKSKAKKTNPRRKTSKKAARPRRRNAEKKSADHPVEVTHHYRAGPPGYMTPWQRAHAAGQSQLFETGIKPAKRRNPRKGTRRRGGRRKSPNPGALLKYEIYVDSGRGKDVIGTVSARSNAEALKIGREKFAPLSISRSARKLKARKIGVVAFNPTRKAARKASRSRLVPRRLAGKGRQGAKPKRRSRLTGGRNPSAKQIRQARDSNNQRLSRMRRKNASAKQIREKFAGSAGRGRDLYFPKGTPPGQLAKLGRLVSITTESGTIKPIAGSAWLCADTRGKLHLGSTSGAPLFDGPARNFGKVSKLEYEEKKPHLGYGKNPIIWFHHVGEESGRKPTLHADGSGGLVFKGGAYRITARGIEN